MKNCSELFSIFQIFYNEIKNQFGISIRILHSDNGHEYLSHSFKNFMASHGILHQTSCAYIPQQNGVAKRKNRHLVETTRTILIHCDFPRRFQGDVILSACYLINRMPSSVLDNKIPHSIFFHMTLSTLYLPKFLSPHALFIILVLVLINYLLSHTNVSFLGSLDHKKDIDVSHLL